MLLVVCGEHDRQAQDLLCRLGPGRAVPLTPADLSAPGWQLGPERAGEGHFVAGRRVHREAELSGVLVRRLAVHAQELVHVHAADREYAAAEQTALLNWWLTSLPVPVLNRPAGGLLCGPFARAEQWLQLAARCGISVAHPARSPQPQPAPDLRWSATVVHGEVIGEVPGELGGAAVTLARASGALLMQAGFDGCGRLVLVHSFPPLTPAVIDAIADRLLARESACELAS
jgi:hypothetical protein